MPGRAGWAAREEDLASRRAAEHACSRNEMGNIEIGILHWEVVYLQQRNTTIMLTGVALLSYNVSYY